MSQRSDWKERIALSLRVGAIVTVLGFVVFAAEQRLAHDAAPLDAIVSEAMLPVATPQATAENGPASSAPPSGDYYFPAQFPAPAGEVEAQPSTF